MGWGFDFANNIDRLCGENWRYERREGEMELSVMDMESSFSCVCEKVVCVCFLIFVHRLRKIARGKRESEALKRKAKAHD